MVVPLPPLFLPSSHPPSVLPGLPLRLLLHLLRLGGRGVEGRPPVGALAARPVAAVPLASVILVVLVLVAVAGDLGHVVAVLVVVLLALVDADLLVPLSRAAGVAVQGREVELLGAEVGVVVGVVLALRGG